MSTVALDKNCDQVNFEEISVAELEVISGGSGGFDMGQCLTGTLSGLGTGLVIGAAVGNVTPGIGWLTGAVIGGSIGAGIGAATSCFG